MEITPGTKVAYSVQFLKSVGMSHSYLARARGVVTEIIPLGSTSLAAIAWEPLDSEELPARVNTFNLAVVGPNLKFCQS